MFVFSVIQVLLILLPLATYSQNTTASPPNNATVSANNTETNQFQVNKIVKLDLNVTPTTTATTTTITGKHEAIVDVEGGTIHLEVSTVKSTLDLPVIPTLTTAVVANIKTHLGREGVSEDTKLQDNISFSSVVHSTTESEPSKSVTVLSEHTSNKQAVTLEDVSANASHSKIVPKKGVDFADMLPKYNTSTTTGVPPVSLTTISKIVTLFPLLTTPKPRPKKPTVTIGGDYDEQPNLVLKTQKNINSTPKVPTIENYEKSKQHNKSTFVIPIVIVILSVPLVAIIINVVYKRGKEWWTHRHYSRMDFLIDGMYNN